MNKMDGKSMNVLENNIEKLKEIFPEVVVEGEVDLNKIRQMFTGFTLDGDSNKERYNFTWNGKQEALRNSQTPSTGTLRPCKEESKNFDETENLYIEGDNLEVLKLLQKSYFEKVKMIYIDPPYNTGNDFVYKDDFKDNLKNYKEITGQVDSEGNNYSTNSESNGRYHSDWLNMMYPRLRLARNLLKEDGVIFVSISEEEVGNLKKICNEVFGERNFRNSFISRRHDKNINTQFASSGLKTLNVGYEYILSYSKTDKFLFSPVYKEASDDRKSKGYWKGFWNDADRPTMRYDILGFTPTEGQWKWKEERVLEAINNYKEYQEKFEKDYTLEEYWGNTGKTKKFIRRNLNGSGKNKGVENWISPSEGIMRNTNLLDILATRTENYLKNLFDYPKNIDLIEIICKLSNSSKNDIILDFFSGSATTAHAVMKLNAEDGGNRKYICVQLPEETDEKSEAYKAGYKNICEIGKERIRRSGKKVLEELKENKDLFSENGSKFDVGFKVLKLDSSNIKKWNSENKIDELDLFKYVDNIEEGRTQEDILYEIILKMGLELTYPIEEIKVSGKTIYTIGFGALMICIDDNVTIEVAERMVKEYKEQNPETWKVVFMDNSFKDDAEKINIIETLKCAGLDEDNFVTI